MQNSYSSEGRTFSPEVQANIASVDLLVRHLANNYARRAKMPALDEDDLYQEGMIVLLALADRYDPKTGPFNRYVAPHIRGRIMNVIRDQKRFRTIPSEIYPPHSPEQKDAANQREAVLQALDSKEILAKEKNVIQEKYMLNCEHTPSLRELGERIGTSHTTINTLERTGLDVLRELCADAA